MVSITSIWLTSSRSITCGAPHQVPGQPGLVGVHRVPGRDELVQQLLEPQLVDLVDGDEQQLVVGGRVDQRHLLREQVRQPAGRCRRSAARPLRRSCAQAGPPYAPPPRPAVRSTRAPRDWRSESGSAASLTGVPVRILRTGTSSFLPDSVRGTPGTSMHLVGHVPRRERRAQQRDLISPTSRRPASARRQHQVQHAAGPRRRACRCRSPGCRPPREAPRPRGRTRPCPCARRPG